MVQIHKEFTDSQVKELIERYLKNEIERKYIQEVLGIGKNEVFCSHKRVSQKSKRIFYSIHKKDQNQKDFRKH